MDDQWGRLRRSVQADVDKLKAGDLTISNNYAMCDALEGVLAKMQAIQDSPADEPPGMRVRVRWMDDQVRDYYGVTSADVDTHGQLVIHGYAGADTGRHPRTIRLPLRNIRWWGPPGSMDSW